jgi:hypothetical protein
MSMNFLKIIINDIKYNLKYFLPQHNKICPSCGYQSAYANFCHKDGKKMLREKRKFPICDYCKKEISTLDYYCRNCGKKLDKMVKM